MQQPIRGYQSKDASVLAALENLPAIVIKIIVMIVIMIIVIIIIVIIILIVIIIIFVIIITVSFRLPHDGLLQNKGGF